MRKSIFSTILYGMFMLLAPVQIAIAGFSDIDYGAPVEYPKYSAQKVVFEFFYDEPEKIASALYWVRSLFKTLGRSPYNHAPDDINVVIVMHGTELVTLAKNNYQKYNEIVERLRYYSELGVKIRVCSQAVDLFGYNPEDFPDFVTLIPAAIAEVIHWQQMGYVLVAPVILEKKFSLEEIR